MAGEGINEDLTATSDRIHFTLKSALRELVDTELATNELAILEQLLKGRRTIRELVLLIYDLRPENEGYRTYYMRVRRALGSLEAKGMVSTKIFGKTKPYRLTRHATEKLINILEDGETHPLTVIRRIDYATYASTMATAITTLYASTRPAIDPSIVLGLAGSSLLLGGISLCRLLETLRRIL